MLTTTGYVPLTTAQALTAIQTIFYNVFGVNADMTVGNPTSQFIQELANMTVNVSNSQSLLYSTIYNRNNATGVFLDGLGAFSGLSRLEATHTTILCTATGTPGTIVPADQIILNNENGDQYTNPNPFTINSMGFAIGVPFAAVESGPVVAPANTITVIQQNVSGWSTINNPLVGTTGSATQNDTSYRNTQNYALALNSTSWFDAVASALTNFLDQNGETEDSTGHKYILGWYIFENYTAAAVDLPGGGSHSVAPHSVYITVYAPEFLYTTGTTQNSINAEYLAGVILNTKSAGSQTQNIQTGDYAFSVAYTNPNYTFQTVTVKYDSPTPVPIKFNITITTFSDTLSVNQIETLIANAVVSQFYNGYESLPPVAMFTDIVASSYIPAIIAAIGNCNVTDITIEKVTAGTPAAIFTALSPLEIPTLLLTDVSITVNS